MTLRAAAALACVLASAGWPAGASAAASAAPGREAAAVAASSAAAPGDEAARAREQARDVLSERRFKPTKVTAPLRGLRERVGDGLRHLGRPFERAFRWVASWLPGGRSVLWVLLAALVLGAAAVLATRAGARRRLAGGGGAGGETRGERRTAAQLLREAERAERSGDLDGALRLRFRAGLLDLDQRELIELRPALTNRELLRDVPSATLEELVEGFEAVAYGGRPAETVDVQTAREGWPRVPDEAGKR